MAQTAMQELLSIMPDAAEIKAFISENDADEKMLDEWLWERLYKGKDWVEKEKQQIVEAWQTRDKDVIKSDGKSAEQYYEEKYGA